MKNLIVIISLVVFVQSYAQNDSIEMRKIDSLSYRIASESSRINSQSNIKLDSVKVSVKKFDNKIETENQFPSGSNLSIIYYLNKSELILVKVTERCPTNKEYSNYTDFYFKHGKIKKIRNYHNVSMCIAIPLNESFYDTYGYNENLNNDFLKPYIKKLHDYMTNHR